MEEKRQPGPVLDVFKIIKIPAHNPVPLQEAAPKSWREVARRFNRYLMRLSVGIPRLLVDLVESGSSCLRGLTIPPRTEKLLEEAHLQADKLEHQGQQRQLAPNPEEAIQGLESILTRCRVEGLIVRLDKVEGSTLLTITRPELEEPSAELAQDYSNSSAIQEE